MHADTTIAELDLDAIGRVPWWPDGRSEITLHQILIHVIAETHRHAGHADIVREVVDGAVGLRHDIPNLPDAGSEWWSEYRQQVEGAAQRAYIEQAASRPPGARRRPGFSGSGGRRSSLRRVRATYSWKVAPRGDGDGSE